MNRFTAYLDSQKLAKLYLRSAEDHHKKNEDHKAIGALHMAVLYQMTACNNIASLYFERRKKR